jgi:hypothetical protein
MKIRSLFVFDLPSNRIVQMGMNAHFQKGILSDSADLKLRLLLKMP